MTRLIPKPQPSEHAPYTAAYIDLVPETGFVLQHLAANFHVMKTTLIGLPEEKLTTPCAEGEWTIKEILLHIMDAERVFTYRALRFARGDMTELPGYEQDDYVPPSQANERSIESIFMEYEALRNATITFFQNVPEAALTRQGVGSGYPLSVRAAVYQIAGHELHHLHSIHENYLSG